MNNSQENIPDGFYKTKDGQIMRKECTCGKSNQACEDCTDCKPKPIGMVGWVCPVCGRGNSPFSSSCPCMPFPQPIITCANTTGGPH